MSGIRISSVTWVVGVLLLVYGIFLFFSRGQGNRDFPMAVIATGAAMALATAFIGMRREMSGNIWPVILRAAIYSAVAIIITVVLNALGI